jgi:hypothetical protein
LAIDYPKCGTNKSNNPGFWFIDLGCQKAYWAKYSVNLGMGRLWIFEDIACAHSTLAVYSFEIEEVSQWPFLSAVQFAKRAGPHVTTSYATGMSR